jgi:hypothetical protein
VLKIALYMVFLAIINKIVITANVIKRSVTIFTLVKFTDSEPANKTLVQNTVLPLEV